MQLQSRRVLLCADNLAFVNAFFNGTVLVLHRIGEFIQVQTAVGLLGNRLNYAGAAAASHNDVFSHNPQRERKAVVKRFSGILAHGFSALCSVFP